MVLELRLFSITHIGDEMKTEKEQSRKTRKLYTAGDLEGRIRILLNADSLHVDLTAWGKRWTWDQGYAPGFYKGDAYISFNVNSSYRFH